MKLIYILGKYILRLIASSWRIRVVGELPQKPAVIAFWHCEMLSIWKFFSVTNSYAVVSLNKDGEILANLLLKWGYKLIRGSSSRKGSEVIDEIVYHCEDNYFFITPDGPRGPRMQCKAGAFVIAQRRGIPLFFIKCATTRKKVFFRSWDKFEFPLPFTRITLTISTVSITKEMSRENITELMQDCDKSFGDV
jgi:lysophospholipid acyltransferase (LPLAT)-like uncharacterized protein